MAIERAEHLSYAEATLVHIALIRNFGEPRYGAPDRTLIDRVRTIPLQTRSKKFLRNIYDVLKDV